MAVAVSKRNFSGFKQVSDTLTDVQNTYTIDQYINPGKVNQYRFYAGWEKTDTMFKTLSGFTQFVKQEAIKYDHPIQIK